MRRLSVSIPTIISATILVATASPALADVSCSSLDTIVADAKNEFRNTYSPQIRSKYNATVLLPGSTECGADEYEYRCLFHARTDLHPGATVGYWDASNAEYLMEKFRNWFANCAQYSGIPQRAEHHRIAYKGGDLIVMEMHLEGEYSYLVRIRP